MECPACGEPDVEIEEGFYELDDQVKEIVLQCNGCGLTARYLKDEWLIYSNPQALTVDLSLLEIADVLELQEQAATY